MSARDEQGLVGKVLLIWLLVLAIAAVSILDFVSITTTRFHIADVAGQAAQDGAAAYRIGGSAGTEKAACDASRASLATADPAIKLTKCSINRDTGDLTITVRKVANTVAVQRIGPLKKYANVVDTETAGPSAL